MQMYKNLLNIILFYIKIKESNGHKKQQTSYIQHFIL